jgi:DNA polymerase elongation subunit (family B)
MSYKNIITKPLGKNKYSIILSTDDGVEEFEYQNYAYETCADGDATHKGLNGEPLRRVTYWDKTNPFIHYHDMPIHQKFLIDKYRTNDTPSTTHKEVFFDIEIEMGGALTPEYIMSAPKPVTSISWWYKQKDEWYILILDKEEKLTYSQNDNKTIIPCRNEREILTKWLNFLHKISPDILVHFNGDYFDIPYLYWRIKNQLGDRKAQSLSPIGSVKESFFQDSMGNKIYNPDQPIKIEGLYSLDYLRLHKKYSNSDEPSYKLDSLGEKYCNLGKIEYEGSLDRLFNTDKDKFIQYNFRDVEIIKALDEKFNYLGLTKNLAHKGKIHYDDVYHSSKIHDGAISAYLLSQGIVPPSKDRNPITKKDYAGGYLFCPKAGLYRYVFDEDLTSLYPSIIMSLNIGKETLIGRILDSNSRNNRLGLNDLQSNNPDDVLNIEWFFNKNKFSKIEWTNSKLIKIIQQYNLSISANGVIFRTDKESVLSTILNKWFNERVLYKNKMKEYYKNGDNEMGERYHLMQYTVKILLNSLYGALALSSFRFGNVLLAEATTLSGQRIICESALCANRHMNKILKDDKFKEEFIKSLSVTQLM